MAVKLGAFVVVVLTAIVLLVVWVMAALLFAVMGVIAGVSFIVEWHDMRVIRRQLDRRLRPNPDQRNSQNAPVAVKD